MAKFSCFTVLKKKKDKGDQMPSQANEYRKALRTLQLKTENQVKPLEGDDLSASISVPALFPHQKDSKIGTKSPAVREATERAYEGEDEHEDNASIKREFSDFDLQAHVANETVSEFKTTKVDFSDYFETEVNEKSVNRAKKDDAENVDRIESGHVSDPGMARVKFLASPKLKRSCSNVETREVLRKVANHLPPSKSQSFEDLQELSARIMENFDPGSPMSVMTRCSADRVMLKKHSSSQVLPSRSRRLWWKLFLWSHRNLHKLQSSKPQSCPKAHSNQPGGYYSDTLEPIQAMKSSKMESPGSFTGESLSKGCNDDYSDNLRWSGFHKRTSSLWHQKQWVAFSAGSSSFSRVDEWVKDLNAQNPDPAEDSDDSEGGIIFPPSPGAGKSPARNTVLSIQHPDVNISPEILHANSIIQSLNSSSTVAHISGIGLKAIPIISRFSSLRSVNLSNNSIVHITPGSLPKGLHTLNLSRNKISTIEGLRELTRLRVLDLSYNRISRIGQGLSNCSLIKELYLAGNKISDVEGLHRLLKLTVLDLSFNKITTTKALGQLVANYNSLLALNLLGNPIQSNISDDQLRKAVCGLLPKLVYLNKQPIKPQRAREVLTDSVAKAALGNGGLSSRRKTVRRGNQGGSVSSSRLASSVTVRQKSRSRSKSRAHHQ